MNEKVTMAVLYPSFNISSLNIYIYRIRILQSKTQQFFYFVLKTS